MRPRRKRALNRTVYPDSPLRLFFTEPGLAPSGGAKTFQVWDPETQNPLQDLDGSNALVTDYVMGNRIDEPLGRVAGGATHAFVGDQVMSIRGLVDSSGVQTNRYTYAAFGLGRSQVEAVSNRLRFTSRELDPATGVQFNRHRHYLASLGRWTQQDPIGFAGGYNLYGYVEQNPLGGTDPLGLQFAGPIQRCKRDYEIVCFIGRCGVAVCKAVVKWVCDDDIGPWPKPKCAPGNDPMTDDRLIWCREQQNACVLHCNKRFPPGNRRKACHDLCADWGKGDCMKLPKCDE